MVILFTVPLALIGVFIGLLVTGWAMGFMANLGILALIGIVINNAIVLIDFIESRVAGGQELRSAVAEAGRLRLQPIVLTGLITVGGLLPLSLFGGCVMGANDERHDFQLDLRDGVDTRRSTYVVRSVCRVIQNEGCVVSEFDRTQPRQVPYSPVL